MTHNNRHAIKVLILNNPVVVDYCNKNNIDIYKLWNLRLEITKTMLVFVKPGNNLKLSCRGDLDSGEPKQMLIIDIDENNNINVMKTQFTYEITLRSLEDTKEV